MNKRIRQVVALIVTSLCASVYTPHVFSGSPIVVQPFPVTGAFSATHREDLGPVSIIEFSGDYNKDLNENPNIEPRTVVAQEFYRTHPDDYDFLVVFTTFEFETGDALAYHMNVQNNVEGIGLPTTFDYSSLYGSNGKLLGYTDMAALSRYELNPLKEDFDFTVGVLGHEIMHQWTSRIHFDQGSGPQDDLLGKDGAHWSNLFDTNASLMYGHKWNDNGDGTFTSDATRKFYSPLDLYLAGLYGADEVPPMTLIENPDLPTAVTPSEGLNIHGSTISGTTNTVTIEHIVAAEGERVPSVDNAQKDFRFAFILLVGPDEEVDELYIAQLDSLRRAFADRFAVWTGGRATANIFPAGISDFEISSPDVVSGGDVRNGDADVADAFTWLRDQQDVSGYWEDKEATRLRDTAVVGEVLTRFDSSFNNQNSARTWIEAYEATSTDFLTRQAQSLSFFGEQEASQALFEDIIDAQNDDGGWGIESEYGSAYLDTALAIQALYGQEGVSHSVINAAISFLRAAQNDDGGWGNRKGSPSRTAVTVAAIEALHKAGQLSDVREQTLSFLISKQNADGGFGDSTSTIHNTAEVLNLLIDIEAINDIRLVDATNYIIDNQTEEGSWDGSVYATALSLSALQRINITNWTISEFTVNAANVTDGENVALSIEVRNDSNQASPATTLTLFDGDAQNGTQIGEVIVVPALNPGQSVRLTFNWDTLDLAGAHDITAVIDAGNAFSESSEADNESVVGVTVQQAPEMADLFVQETALSISPESPSNLPSDLAIAATVRNLGLTDAASVVLQLRKDSETGEVLEEQVLDVPARSSIAANFTYQLTESGAHTFFVVADPANVIPEVNSVNNAASIRLNTTDSVDFSVVSSDIVLDSVAPLVGEDVNFTVTLRNLGTLSTPSTEVVYTVTDGSTTTELLRNTVQMDVGESVETVIPWRVDREGALTFTVQIDEANLIAETSESNNIASTNFSSGQATGPNLAVNFADITFSENPAAEALPLTISALIRNTGTLDASNIEVAFYDGDPANGGVQIESTQIITNLVSEGDALVEIVWPAIPDAIDRTVFVVVDPQDSITEFRENDNQAFLPLPVLSMSDLSIDTGAIVINPSFPRAGDTIDITATISNLGQQNVESALVRFYFGEPGQGGVQIGSDQFVGVVGNNFADASVSYGLASDIDLSAIYVQVDPDNVLLEQSKINNTASRSLSVQNGNFYVSEQYISPNGDDIQESTNFFFRLDGTYDVTIVVQNEFGETVRTFSDSTLLSIQDGSIEWDGRDDRGVLVDDGEYSIQVLEGTTVLGDVGVVLDTNRSSIMDAVGTPFGNLQTLTCEQRWYSYLLSGEDEGYISRITNLSSSARGLYSSNISGGNLTPIAVNGSHAAPVDEGYIATSDLSKVAYLVNTGPNQVWVADRDGSNAFELWREAGFEDSHLLGFSSDEQSVIVQQGTNVYVTPISGAPGQILFSNDWLYSGWIKDPQLYFSSDGNYLIFNSVEENTLHIVNVNLQNTITIPYEGSNNNELNDVSRYNDKIVFSPDGSRFAFSSVQTTNVRVYSIDGGLQNEFEAPGLEQISVPEMIGLIESEAYWVDTFAVVPAWSTVSNELFLFTDIRLRENCDCNADEIGASSIHAYDLETDESIELVDFVENRSNGVQPEQGRSDRFFAVPGERSAIFESWPRAIWVANAGNGGSVEKVAFEQGDVFELDEKGFSNSGRYLYLYSYEISSASCSNSDNIYSFSSLLNLTSDLRAISEGQGQGILLSGTAADANFDRYEIDYANINSPEVWRPIIAPSSQPVGDSDLALWIPPASGTYLLRLTTFDLAGNSRESIVRVSSSDTSAISDFYRSSSIFSPNGDGVEDTSSIQYRITTPVNLEFKFFNEDGVLVHTVERSHTQVGQTFSFDWDGRDSQGIQLPDGNYRLEILNFEFDYTLDRTPPVVALEFNGLQTTTRAENDATIQVYAVSRELSYSVFDENIEEAYIEDSPVLISEQWERWLNLSNEAANGVIELEVDAVGATRYRLVARDLAGNESVLIVDPIEQLVVDLVGNHEVVSERNLDYSASVVSSYDETLRRIRNRPPVAPDSIDGMEESEIALRTIDVIDSKVQFRLNESLTNRLSSVNIEYRLHSDDVWTTESDVSFFNLAYENRELSPFTEIDSASSAKNRFHVVWLPEDVVIQEPYYVRINATDELGNTFTSNQFLVEFFANIVTIENWVRFASDDEYGSYIAPKLSEQADESVSANDYSLWGIVNSDNAIQELTVSIEDSNSEAYEADPRYVRPVQVGLLRDVSDSYVIEDIPLQPCHAYSVTVETQIETVDESTGELRISSSSVTKDLPTPCLGVETAVAPVFAETCNSIPPGILDISMAATAWDGNALSVVGLTTEDENNILFNENDPRSGDEYLYQFDTAAEAEGILEYSAFVINEVDDLARSGVPLIIDHTPPVIAINYPADSQRICGIPTTITEGGITRDAMVAAIEGVVNDANPMYFTIEASSGPTFNESDNVKLYSSVPEEVADEANWERISRINSNTQGLLEEVDLIEFDGEVTLRLNSYDFGGHFQCSDRSFVFDSQVSVSELTASGAVFSGGLSWFSPNGDSTNDSLTIDFAALENLQFSVSLFNAVENSTGSFGIQGGAIASLLSNQSLEAGPAQYIWDGSDGGGVVTDSVYGLVFDFVDSCGLERSSTIFVGVDTTPPQLSIDYPNTGDQLQLIVDIQGTVNDVNLSEYRVEVGEGVEPTAWGRLGNQLPASLNVPTTSSLALWNTYGISGDYSIRIIASDLLGNESEVQSVINVSERVDLFSYFDVVDQLISPNGDGRLESTAIRFSAENPITVSLEVFSGATSIRQLSSSTEIGQGPQIFAWDGRNGAGDVVADGDYEVRLTASLTSNPLVQQVVSLSVEVDATSPVIDLIQPLTGFVPSTSSVLGSVGDLNLKSYAVHLAENVSPIEWLSLSQGNQSVSSAVLAQLNQLGSNEYRLRVFAEDYAENQSEVLLNLTVDSIAPQANVVSPIVGSFISSLNGMLPISAQYDEENPDSFVFDVRPSLSDTPTTLFSGSIPGQTELWEIGEWDFSSFADGEYLTRLVVNDRAGNLVTVETPITLDSTLPTVSLVTPTDGQLVSSIVVEGTAEDTNLESYEIALAEGVGEDATRYSVIGRGSESVSSGELLNASVLPADGTYTLRLRATDHADNSADVFTTITIDTTAPETPLNVSVQLDGNSGALNWDDNSESDLAGYFVYRNGAALNSEAIASSDFLDTSVVEGSYVYQVSAVDTAGNESPLSAALNFELDLTPPDVAIVTPLESDLVSGFADVIGTAFSSDDFLEYRLYVASVTDLDSLTLVRRSPVPLRADILGSIDTTNLVEGGQYQILLEAEDINSNISTAAVNVYVDNTAPAQPTGLTAVPSSNNVNLTWNANTENDLRGYILFRNGKVANAVGTVVGDLGQYAIDTTSFADESLADGDYEYTLVAIDNAGNISVSSVTVNITIDIRTPVARIVSAENGQAFDNPLYVLAVSEDSDIADIEFQYRVASTGSWATFGIDNVEPFDSELDPIALGMIFGSYDLRAVATDLSGNTDATPEIITVQYQDVTRPASVSDVTISVNEDDVSLAWTANSETDLAGYYVDRVDEQNNVLRLTSSPVGSTSYMDSDVAIGLYQYRVIAVDTADNESTFEPRGALVYQPELFVSSTYTSDSNISINGRGEVPATAIAEVTNLQGSTTLPEVITDEAFAFVLENIELAFDENVLQVQMRDAAGNISLPAELNILRVDVPAQVTGLTGSAVETDVTLDWNENPEPNIAGYKVYRNGEVIFESRVAVTDGIASASSNDGAAANTFDNSTSSYWESYSPYDGQWLQYQWPENRVVEEIYVRSRYSSGTYNPTDNYDIEAWVEDQWLVIDSARNETPVFEKTIVLDRPVFTDRIRFVVRENQRARIATITPFVNEMQSGTSFNAIEPNGDHSYTVSAVNEFSIEGPQSEALALLVGDFNAPDPVTLSGETYGWEVDLFWTASSSPDVTSYRVDRNGNTIAIISDPATLDYFDDVENGTHEYIVVAIDSAGNESAPSNIYQTTIDIAPLEAVTNLTASAAAESLAIELQWDALDPAPTNYAVLRSETSGSDFVEIGIVSSNSYIDTDISSAVTYYYIVAALDQVGNAGNYSNEVNAFAIDNIPPEVTITEPASAGQTYLTGQNVVDIAGFSESAATIDLWKDGLFVGSTEASSDTVTDAAEFFYGFSEFPKLSPNGKFYAFVNEGSINLYDMDTGVSTPVVTLSDDDMEEAGVQWMPDSNSFVYLNFPYSSYDPGELRSYNLIDGSIEIINVAQDAGVRLVKPSPDGLSLAITAEMPVDDNGEIDFVPGLWIYSFESGESTWITDLDIYSVIEMSWSKDGDYIAYMEDFGSNIEIVNTNTGAVQSVLLNDYTELFAWSPVDNVIAYFDYDDSEGTYGLYTYNVDSQAITHVLADPDQDVGNPLWSPDGGSLYYMDFVTRQIYNLDIETSSVRLHYQMTGFGFLFESNSAGFLSFDDGDTLVRQRLPGYFEFDNINLVVGENLFSVQASDNAGNQSEMSENLIVSYLGENQADLIVEPRDILLFPSVPNTGESIQFGINVLNQGRLTAGQSTLDAVLIAPDGTSQVVFSGLRVGEITAGSSLGINAEFTLDDAAGEYSLVVYADVLNEIEESSEYNNIGIKTFVVAEDGGVTATVNTNQSNYASNQNVQVDLVLSNPGSEFSGHAEVQILDFESNFVASVSSIQISQFGYGETLNVSELWNTGSIFAGQYIVSVQIFDSLGEQVDSTFTEFEISGSSEISTSVSSDRISYVNNSDVTISGLVSYLSGNTVLSGLEAQLRILDPQGLLVLDNATILQDLVSGSDSGVTLDWNTGSSDIGSYRVEIDVIRNNTIISSSSGSFDIEDSGIQVSGTIDLANSSPAYGEPVLFDARLENLGNQMVSQLPVSVVVQDIDSLETVFTEDLLVDIGISGEFVQSIEVDSTSLDLRDYRIVLLAEISDADGNSTLDSSDFNLRDRSAPIVNILSPSDGAGSPSDFDVVITAADAQSNVDSVQVRVDGGPWQSTLIADSVAGTYRLSLSGVSDGEHSILARAFDSAGNQGVSTTVAISVDGAAPTIVIDGVVENEITNNDLTPVIQITDTNLNTTRTTLNGEDFVSGSQISGEGSYVLEVYADDLAGNISRSVRFFEIDKTAPLIEISGVSDGDLVNTSLTPTIVAVGEDVVNESATLNGASFVSSTEIVDEGVYLLAASAADAAGNTSSLSVSFEIDLTAPVIVVTSPESNSTTNASQADIVGTAEALSSLSLSITGSENRNTTATATGEFSFASVPLVVGDNTFTINATDLAGNSAEEVSLILTRSQPSSGPSDPTIVSPMFGGTVMTLRPALTVENSTITPESAIQYEYEIYSDESMSQLVESELTDEQDTNTIFIPANDLVENSRYYWRVRALGAELYSQWVTGEFFVNSVNEAPGVFNTTSPADGSVVSVFDPTLTVTNSVDPDGDALTYTFELYLDDLTGPSIWQSALVDEGMNGTTGVQVGLSLQENTLYYWRVSASDGNGLSTWSNVSSFFVDTENDSPSTPEIITPEDQSEVASDAVDLVITAATDPDDTDLLYEFEIDAVNTFDSAALVSSGLTSELTFAISGMSEDTTYYWRARASDGFTNSEWVDASFFVNAVNSAPPVPTINNPGDGAWVSTLQPTLSVLPVEDNDGDQVTYRFELYSDSGLTTMVDTVTSIDPEWIFPTPLQDNAWHYWRVRSEDDRGAQSEWTETVRFFTNDNNIDDAPIISFVAPSVDMNVSGVVDIQWQDSDPDSSATISLYYDSDSSGADGVLIASGIAEDTDGSVDSYSWDISGLASGDYYVYAVITDTTNSVIEYNSSRLTVGGSGAPVITSTGPTELEVDQTYTYQVEAYDPQGGALTYSLIFGPEGMYVDGDGLITWNTDTDDAGKHGFKVAVYDAEDLFDEEYVYVNVRDPNNLPPEFNVVAPSSVNINSLFQLDPGIIDPNGDDVSFNYGIWPDTSGLSVDSNNVISWTPEPGQEGTFWIWMQANDGKFGEASSTHEVHVYDPSNNAPEITNKISNTTVTVGVPFVYDLQAQDIDGDILTYFLSMYPIDIGATISDDGIFEWTPSSEHLGNEYYITVKVDDGKFGEDIHNFKLLVQGGG